MMEIWIIILDIQYITPPSSFGVLPLLKTEYLGNLDYLIFMSVIIYIYIYIEGSLIQGTEGYSGFSSTNYLNMANVIKKGEFLDQYQIHQIYWIYLDQRRDSYLLSSEVSWILVDMFSSAWGVV